MFKRTISAVTTACLLSLGVIGLSTSATATQTTPCVPHDAVAAYDDPPIVVHEAYDDPPVLVTAAYNDPDTTVVDVEAVNKWYSWTGGQTTEHPAPPAGSWQVDNGEHNGFPQNAGVYERPKGNSDNSAWFYHVVITEQSHVIPGAHHDAVYTPGAHHDAVTTPGAHHDAIPAVVCPGPQEPVTQYATFIWKMDQYPAVNNIWPQTYVNSVITALPNLGAFDSLLVGKCVGYQVDVYKYTNAGDKAAVDYLKSNGHLTGPNTPPEPLISGGLGTAWKFYQNDDCEVAPGVAAASWTATQPTCDLDRDGKGVLLLEHATLTGATRNGEPFAEVGWPAGDHNSPTPGVWVLTFTAETGFLFSNGTNTLVTDPIEIGEWLTDDDCTVVPPPVCSPTEDTSHWQRYSWVGGTVPEGTTPVWTGPDDENWQANTASDPHKIGQAGAYDRGHPGHADWFYLEWVDQPPCPPTFPVPAQFNAEPTGPDCGIEGDFSEEFDGGSLLYVTEGGVRVYSFAGDTVRLNVDREGLNVDLYLYTTDDETVFTGLNTDLWSVNPDGRSAFRTITLGAAVDFQNDDPEAPCFQRILTPTLVVTDACGVDNDGWVAGVEGDGIVYEHYTEDDQDLLIASPEVDGDVVAAPEGWIETSNDRAFYDLSTLEFTNVPCPVTVTPPPVLTPPVYTVVHHTTPTYLASTGSDGAWAIGIIAATLAGLGGALMVARKRYSRI